MGNQNSLEDSRLLLSIISPSYIKSDWCKKEWQLAQKQEAKLRLSNLLPSEQGIIVPILLYPLDRGNFNSEQQNFLNEVKSRQWYDLSSRINGTPLRASQITEIVETIIDISSEINSRTSRDTISEKVLESSLVIIDETQKIMWSGILSQNELTISEAKKYVKELNIGGHKDWRLPTEKELENIIETNLLDENPKSSPYPLKPPFNAQRFGYLHSGTFVGSVESNGNLIMNVRNGHIFNGKGYKAHVRAVRDI